MRQTGEGRRKGGDWEEWFGAERTINSDGAPNLNPNECNITQPLLITILLYWYGRLVGHQPLVV